ncbi:MULTISPECIES: hypothetical protein [unclassified Psychrobacter]|uniref:hypothetical protein n=1 Tax=unclassified Psychrobacter TaxID=196806 RepID=UPI00178795A6|nr:hypothetical protein [Psychrobacter sp. FME13]MBE0441741.1 hypothetical protein [Psychrobacter sp. FME13]
MFAHTQSLTVIKRLSLLTLLTASSYAFALDVNFVDSKWDGETVPEGQQCQKFDGVNPGTPKLLVSDIPARSDSVVLVYSDRDSKKMNNGGHGIMSYTLVKGTTTAQLPTVSGHTYELPTGFEMIAEHRGAGWDKEGAYMPPCSGGNGHEYYVTVQTYEGNTVTAETVLELGKF